MAFVQLSEKKGYGKQQLLLVLEIAKYMKER